MVLGGSVSEVADVSAAGMIIPLGPLKVMVATKPVDFRKGAIGLAALVEHELAGKPFSGVSCVFRAKLANRIKLLVWDGSGLVLLSTVLQTGAFHWPRAGDGVMRLSAAQMSALFEGLQWSRMHVPSTPKPIAAQQVARLNRLVEPVDTDAAKYTRNGGWTWGQTSFQTMLRR